MCSHHWQIIAKVVFFQYENLHFTSAEPLTRARHTSTLFNICFVLQRLELVRS